MKTQGIKLGSSKLRLLLPLVGIFSLFGFHAHAIEQVETESARLALEARVDAVRQTLRVAEANAGNKADVAQRLAQWYNWPNWPNWNNWGNWGNWGNWNNWFNG